MLLHVCGKRSCTCFEIESKCNLFKIRKKERDNMERLISFTRNGESRIKRENLLFTKSASCVYKCGILLRDSFYK